MDPSYGEMNTYKCPYCARMMKSKQHMESHIRIHTGEKPFKCNRCCYASNQSVNLRIHLQKYKNVPYQCDYCDLKFCSLKGLQSHKKEDHDHTPASTHNTMLEKVVPEGIINQDAVTYGEAPNLPVEDDDYDFEDEEMDETFPNPPFLHENTPEIRIESVYSMEGPKKTKKIYSPREPVKRKVHENKFFKKKSRFLGNKFRCIYCNKSHKNRSHLEEHVRIHTGERPFKCAYCNYAAMTASSLRTHNKSSTGSCLKCDHCNFTSCTLPVLHRHTKKEHTGNLIPLETPVIRFQGSTKATKKVVPKKLPKKSFKRAKNLLHCDRCSYSTDAQLNMDVHLRHRKNKPVHFCSECKYSACFLIGLAKHRKLMHGNSPRKTGVKKRAKINHQKKFEREDSLVPSDVENLPMYGCAYCTFFSLDKTEVKIHLGFHNGPRPYSCIFCSRRFTTRINAEVHERIHTGLQPYQCNSCGKNFSQKCNLHTHLRSKHGIHVEGRKFSKKSKAKVETGSIIRRNTIDAAVKVSRKYRA